MDSILYANFYGVPIMTYGMIGVTTLALAYFTLTDTDSGSKTDTTSTPSAPQEPTEPTEPQVTTGGGSKTKRKRHIKSKSSKKK
jgi:hypothetical protein